MTNLENQLVSIVSSQFPIVCSSKLMFAVLFCLSDVCFYLKMSK